MRIVMFHMPNVLGMPKAVEVTLVLNACSTGLNISARSELQFG
jgi:hypothetical protein